ncbi:MAG: hypothetical protein ACI8PZ_007051, partial [Myxococcota bacterium]
MESPGEDRQHKATLRCIGGIARVGQRVPERAKMQLRPANLAQRRAETQQASGLGGAPLDTTEGQGCVAVGGAGVEVGAGTHEQLQNIIVRPSVSG